VVRQSRYNTDHHPGIPLIDIREYFGSEEKQKPGKKGISLKLEEVNKMHYCPYYSGIDDGPQWQTLKQNVDAIDIILSSVKTKD
jgi:hypothetical protein